MIKGIDRFRQHFKMFSDQYVLIGGSACVLAMEEFGLDFRATKDLDIVLCVESLTTDFVKSFWEFIREGGYSICESSGGKKQYYRFQKPSNPDFPVMLELFSKNPNSLNIDNESHLTPIPVEDDVSSLSAILLDETYYHWIHSGKKIIDDIQIVDALHLIPLKARAWLDLTERKETGGAVDSRSIKKHRNDVFRLSQLLSPKMGQNVPELIKKDMKSFIEIAFPEDINLKNLGIVGLKKEEVSDQLKGVFGV